MNNCILACIIAICFPFAAAADDEYGRYARYLGLLTLSDPKPAVANVAGGFGASQGTVFGAVSYTNFDQQTRVKGDDDGSMAFGFGFGDPHTIAAELTIGITSVSTGWWGDGRFADEGNVSLKLHRHVPALILGQSASMAIGAGNVAGWGATRHNPTNYFVAYSERAYFGDFEQYGLMYSFGYGTGVSNLETSSDIFYGVGVGYDDYNVSLSQIGSETHVTGMLFFPKRPEFGIALTLADALDKIDSRRMILTLSYAAKLF